MKFILTENKNKITEEMTDEQKDILRDFYERGSIEYADNDEFLIVDSWETVKELEDELGKPLDKIFNLGWGFSDEFYACDNCKHLIDLEPTMGAKQYYVDEKAGEILCDDCVRKDPSDYLQHLYNNSKSANTILDDVQLKDLGFELINDRAYENGFYGIEDDPDAILKELLNDDPEGTYIFSITGANPFSTNFTVWKKVK